MKQERELSGVKFILDADNGIAETDPINVPHLTEDQRVYLQTLRERRAQLRERVHAEDYYRLKQLIEVTDGKSGKVDQGTLGKLDAKGLEFALDMLGEVSFEAASA